jgi:uncharacterized coiled-coil DUF342 family protein
MNKIFDFEQKIADINEELEQLPNVIGYFEEKMEETLEKIDKAKAEKDILLAETLCKYQTQPTITQKAAYKRTLAEQNLLISKLKRELGTSKVLLNKAKNRFQSVRKIANLKIEEMKNDNDTIYRRGGGIK